MATQSYEIAPAGPSVTVTTHAAGENARLFFDGAAGQRVALAMSNVAMGASTCCSAQVSIWKPDGSNLVYPTLVGTNGGFVDTRALPVSGRYSMLVDPQGTAFGSMTLTLYDVPPDVTGSISPGGPAVTVSMGPVPGQNAILRFDGTAGQRVSVRLSPVTIGTSTCCSAQVSIWKPDGSNLVYPTLVGTTGGFLDTKALPVSGSYTILVDPQKTDLGAMTLALYDVPPDVDASISPGGPPVSVSMGPVPGQNAVLRFFGLAGPARQRGYEQRHDRHLRLLLGPGLDLEAGRLEPRLSDPRRNDRRLPRHAGATGERHVHDPGRPPEHEPRLDDVDAL